MGGGFYVPSDRMMSQLNERTYSYKKSTLGFIHKSGVDFLQAKLVALPN